MREIRLSGSEGGGTGNSTGPPYPYPRPCSSERAVPAMPVPKKPSTCANTSQRSRENGLRN